MKKSLSILLVIVFLLPLVCMAETEPFSNNPDMIEKAALSVLKLSTFDTAGDPIATGSGFLMFDNMTLVTNYHVMEDAVTMVAESDDGYQYFITGIKIANKEKDIAIMKFMTPTVMAPLEYSLDKIKRGERVTAIGSPKGLKNTVSMGNVSAVFTEDNVDWIQTTAPISHGSSGGALFNEAGKVIGITSASRTDGQNLNFAINISEVVTLYQSWDQSVTPLGQQAGLVENYIKMGDSYYYGDGVEQNYEKAVEYYAKAAKLNDASAMVMLGRCYYNGDGVDQNYKIAISYFTQAANLEHPLAWFYLGVCYENGYGVIKNASKAVEYYELAASFDIPQAWHNLGWCYESGTGINKDQSRAVECYLKAANSEISKLPESMFRLGLCYMLGNGVDADPKQAFYWSKSGAELGSSDSMFLLALLYNDGIGTNVDYQKSFEWCSKAAELGNSSAMHMLGKIYLEGRAGVVNINKGKAFECFATAAELGNVQAMTMLASSYILGNGVEQDFETGFSIALQAANLGDPNAMSLVGICYSDGIGVKKNINTANEWFQKAADLGDEYAKSKVKQNKKITFK